MNNREKESLKKCWADLLDHIDSKPTLASFLYSKDILTMDDMDEINAEHTRTARAQGILRQVELSDNPRVFAIFVEALENQWPYVAAHLNDALEETHITRRPKLKRQMGVEKSGVVESGEFVNGNSCPEHFHNKADKLNKPATQQNIISPVPMIISTATVFVPVLPVSGMPDGISRPISYHQLMLNSNYTPVDIEQATRRCDALTQKCESAGSKSSSAAQRDLQPQTSDSNRDSDFFIGEYEVSETETQPKRRVDDASNPNRRCSTCRKTLTSSDSCEAGQKQCNQCHGSCRCEPVETNNGDDLYLANSPSSSMISLHSDGQPSTSNLTHLSSLEFPYRSDTLGHDSVDEGFPTNFKPATESETTTSSSSTLCNTRESSLSLNLVSGDFSAGASSIFPADKLHKDSKNSTMQAPDLRFGIFDMSSNVNTRPVAANNSDTNRSPVPHHEQLPKITGTNKGRKGLDSLAHATGLHAMATGIHMGAANKKIYNFAKETPCPSVENSPLSNTRSGNPSSSFLQQSGHPLSNADLVNYSLNLDRCPDKGYGFNFISGRGRERFSGDIHYYVTAIAADSPSAKSRIMQVKDTIVTVDGHEVKDWDYDALIDYFRCKLRVSLIMHRGHLQNP